jgi:hypothetical protein
MGRIEGRKRREMRGGPVAALYCEAGEGNQRKGMDLTRGAGLAVREGKKAGSGPVRSFGPRWAGMREREGEGLERSFFFSQTLIKSFSNFKFKLFFNFSNFQNILKLHTNKKTPCIQKIMHKHLLPLNLLKMMFNYFRAKI